MNFNHVAAHAIMSATLNNHLAKSIASKLLDHLRRQSATFLCRIPTRLSDTSMKSELNIESSSRNTKHHSGSDNSQPDGSTLSGKRLNDEEHQYNVIIDRLFFDRFCKNDSCVLEYTHREENVGRGYISIAKKSNFGAVCDHLIRHGSSMFPTDYSNSDEALYHCGAQSAVAHLQIGT